MTKIERCDRAAKLRREIVDRAEQKLALLSSQSVSSTKPKE